ncbi:hypothetical protein V2J09_010025 [Rumex salicifolius]
MSGTRGGAGGGGSNAVNGKGSSGSVAVSIPQSAKKIVQSLKEIVNCPDAEIYSMLKECDMDPNETVNRLLSQDPFHEVKSKREKKKETKDTTDVRSRGGNSTINRVGRGGNERRGRESGALRAKLSSKKDNGPTYTNSSSGPMGNNMNWNPPVSETPIENKAPVFNVSEGVPSLQSSAGFRSPWSGVPGQLSMADIVKMGRPQGRASSNVNSSQHNAINQNFTASQAAPTPYEHYSSQSYADKINADLGMARNQSIPPDDDWPQDEQQPTFSAPSISEPPLIPEQYKDPSLLLPFDGIKHHLDEVRYSEDADVDSRRSKMHDESSASAPILSDELHDSINSYQVDRRIYEQQEDESVGVSVSSVAANLQHLNLSREEDEEEEEEEEEYEDEEDDEEEAEDSQGIGSPAVKIPDHLVVQSADCSHLSFGSFGSGMGASLSGPYASVSSQSNVVEPSTAPSAPPMGYTDARNTDYYDDEHRIASDGNNDHRLAVSSGSYDMPSASQPPETLKQESAEPVVGPGNEYSFPSPTPNYAYENSQQDAQDQHMNASFSHSQISSQMQNLPLSGIMSHPNAMPSSLLPSNVHTVRDAELSYLPFPITQSMPTKYSSGLASINGPTNSMAEALKTGNLSSPQLTQNIPGGSISGGPAFPQHLPVHPYSQPSLPFANMIGYPFLPQSYTFMPSAFQQAIAAAGNSTYHQSLSASLLPQYKNSGQVNSLPQSAALPSGYGAFGSSSNVPGNFSLNPPSAAAPPSTTMSYDDVLSSQYKDAAHMLALQQNESSPLWVQGPGSRTMSAVPASTYYSFQGQNQQPAGYRHTQQPSQHYGNPAGYPNFYHNQSGVPLEQQQHQQQQQQQQMSRDGSIGGSQGQQQPKQPQQIWQNSY